MTTRTRLNAELATRRYTRRHAREIVTAVLGNNSGTVVATTDTRWYWIRLHADPNQVVRAWNTGFVPPVPNLPVDVEIVKANGITDYQIIGVSLNRGVVADVNAGATGSHALQHQRRDFNTGGFDPLDIYGRAIVQLRARAQATPDMTLYVEAGWYSVAGIATYFAGGNSPAFTPPGSGFRCDLLYLDNTGTLQIVTGAAVPFGTPVRPAQPSADDLPLAYVYLSAASTSVTEYLIEDGRMVFGGAGGGVGAHNILSATHGDTTVSAPSDDNVLTWDTATGKWRAEALPTLGAGWTRTLDNTPGSHIMAFANCGNGLIIAGGDDNTPSGAGNGIVRRSWDGGQTWGAGIVVDVAIDNLVDCLCYVGSGIVLAGMDVSGKLYRSTNYGATWTYITALDTDSIYSIIKLSDGSILASTLPNGKIYRSTDNGATWNLQFTAWPVSNSKCIYDMCDCGGGVVIAGGGAVVNGGYIYKSTDYGVTWTRKSLLDAIWSVLSVAYDGTKLYASTTNPAKVYLSTDLGETWDGGTVLDTFPIWSLQVLDAGGVIAGTMNNWNTGVVNGGNVYRTSDHGATWNLWKALPGYAIGLIDAGGGHPLAGVSGWYTSPSSIWAYLGGDAQVPYGTGFRHVTLGAEDPAAKLVVNADVDAAAAIVESKLALNYATHAQVHAIDGASHSAAGLTIGNVLTATGAASFAFQAPATSGGGGHLHGLDRWVADGVASAFDLLDFAEYVDSVTDNGSDVDALTYSLSADGTQVVFDSIPTNTHILQCNYVIMGG